MGQSADYMALSRLAIRYADGVIQGAETVAPELTDYISSLEGKAFLPYQGKENYEEAFDNFYSDLLTTN